MQRPASIVTFELSYLAALVLGIANTILNWSHTQAMPPVQRANEQLGTWFAPTVSALGYVVPIVLLFCVARRGSVIAKWIVTLFAAMAALSLLYGLLTGTFVSTLAAAIAVAATALNLFAASRLFRSDTRAWFGEDLGETDA